jgi:hypothetical protein
MLLIALHSKKWNNWKSLFNNINVDIDPTKLSPQELHELLLGGIAGQPAIQSVLDNLTIAEKKDLKLALSEELKSDDEDLVAQGPRPMDTPSTGFTQVVTSEEQAPSKDVGNLSKSIANLAVASSKISIPYASESFVKREVFDWSSTSTAGTILKTYQIPFDILTLGVLTTAQNVGFMNFIYSQPELEIAFQINGTPVQQGALVAFFCPLWNNNTTSPDYVSWLSFDHLVFTPNNHTTRVMRIPFRFWKTWLNNKIGFTTSSKQSMGVLYVGVQSQLTTQTLPTTASVSVFSRFISDFSIPRPRTVTGQGPLLDFNFVDNSQRGNVVGDAPMQQASQTVISNQNEVPMQTLPMDNPPLAGGSLPVHQKWSSLSKSVGVEPTNALQLNQAMMHRQPKQLNFQEQTLVSDLCGRKGYFNSYTISTSDTAGTEVAAFSLDSTLTGGIAYGLHTKLPPNINILNQFQRWRADIILDIFAIKTVFHSFRLQVVAGYGYPVGLGALDWTGFPSIMMEFTDETQWRSVRIPYNAPTEFLRTWDGALGTVTPFVTTYPDHSMGAVSIFLANPLKASSSVVSSSVELQAFVRFENVEVYEPRATSYIGLDADQLPYLVGQGPMDTLGSESNSTSFSTGTVNQTPNEGDQEEPESIPITNVRAVGREAPCDLRIGAKYEYLCRDIREIGRRYHLINIHSMAGFSQQIVKGSLGINPGYDTTANFTAYSFYVEPQHPIKKLFRGWSGHIKYRIFLFPDGTSTVSIGGPATVSHVPCYTGTVTQAAVSTSASPFTAVSTANTSIFDAISAFGGPITIGQTAQSTTALWNANTYMYVSPKFIPSPATEFFYQVSNGLWMADISIPFNTNYNYLPTQIDNETSFMDPYNGRVVIRVPRNSSNGINIVIYEAFGDDFEFHCYGPYVNMYADAYNKSGTITTPPAGTTIGQSVL